MIFIGELEDMKYLLRSILILLFSIQTHAADVYDAKTGILTIGTVSVGDILYSNVKVTVGNILSVGVVEIDDSYDQYNTVNNQLQIPVVSVGEQKYFNVKINVGDILFTWIEVLTTEFLTKFFIKIVFENFI